MKIAVVGGGWYGCHLALALKRAGHEVVLYEKNDKIFGQISGNFGIRLHKGPHYPRSDETRKYCLRSYEEFKKNYPELVIPHEYSLYALGDKDAEGLPPKVGPEHFKKVCEESENFVHLDPEAKDYPYKNLLTATHVEEVSIALGDRLRQAFVRYLAEAGIEVLYNSEVREIEHNGDQLIVHSNDSSQTYDKVINSTSYQALVTKDQDFPFDMEVVYQTCLALQYTDKTPGEKPFSFIVMDGWFPCIMPVCDGSLESKYILTHGKWTIMGSWPTSKEAREILDQIDDEWINNAVKPLAEEDVNRFWPAFKDRFEYMGWKGTVLAKIKTRKEFRSAVTYEKDGVIQIIPGKVQNIFDVEEEVKLLLAKMNLLESKGYLYVKGGVLDLASAEIIEKPDTGEPNTSNLRTFEELNNKAEAQKLKSSEVPQTQAVPLDLIPDIPLDLIQIPEAQAVPLDLIQDIPFDLLPVPEAQIVPLDLIQDIPLDLIPIAQLYIPEDEVQALPQDFFDDEVYYPELSPSIFYVKPDRIRPPAPELSPWELRPSKIKDTKPNNYFILYCLAAMAVTVSLLALFLLTLFSVAIVTTVVVIGVSYCAYRLFSDQKEKGDFIEPQPGESNRIDHSC